MWMSSYPKGMKYFISAPYIFCQKYQKINSYSSALLSAFLLLCYFLYSKREEFCSAHISHVAPVHVGGPQRVSPAHSPALTAEGAVLPVVGRDPLESKHPI